MTGNAVFRNVNPSFSTKHPEASQHESRLLSLADELILNIIEQIDAIEALRHFVLTCQKARDRAEPYIYRHLVFRGAAGVANYSYAFSQDIIRGKHALDLDVRYKAPGRHGISALNDMVEYMPNLRSWRIESPCPNDSLVFNFTGNFEDGAGVLEYWRHVPNMNHLHSSMYLPVRSSLG
jgi:hypothetical protein